MSQNRLNKSKLLNFLFRNKTTSQTIAKNTLWLSFGEVTGRFLRVIIIFFAARILGVAAWGTFSYMTSLAAILTIFADIGVSTVLIREVSKDKTKKNELFSTTLLIKAILVLLGFIFIVFGSQLITGINLPTGLIWATALLFLFDSLRRFGSALFRAEEKMEYEAIINIFTQIVIVAAGFIVLFTQASPSRLALAYAGGSAIGLLVTGYILRESISQIRTSFNKDLIKPLLSAAWPMTLSTVFGMLLINIDVIMIGWFESAESVGLYTAAQKPISFLYLLPALIVGGLFPTLSKYAKSNKEKFRAVMEDGVGVILTLALPIVVGIVMLSSGLIDLVYGEEFLGSAGPLSVLSLSILITFPATVIIHAIFAHHKEKKMVPIWLGGVLINIALNLVLIPRLGIIGAAWASLITQLFTNGTLWILVNKISPFKIRDIYVVFRSAILMGVAILVMKFMSISVVGIIILSPFVYLILLILHKDKNLLGLISTIKGHVA